MNFQLEKPEAVVKAQEKRRGLNWFLELLVFVALFFVVTIGEAIVQMPGEMFMLFRSADYQAAIQSGDFEQIMAATMQIINSDSYMVMSLFANIAMILIVFLFCKLIQKRGLATLGFTRKGVGKEYLIGLGVGFLAFSAAVLICVVTGALRFEGFSENFKVGMFLLFLVGFMIQGMAEEVLCRGYLMVSIGRRYPMWAAVILNALIFACLHLPNSGISVLAFINLTLFGVFASIYFIKRGNIWGIGAFHTIWNLVQGNFYGISVSGMSINCSVFKSTMVEGKSMINGGAFGLEGGLGVTIVFLAGILLLLCLKQRHMENEQEV